MAKLLFCFFIMPLMLVAGFNFDWLSSNSRSPLKSLQQVSKSPQTEENYPKTSRTREEVLLEMRTNGWLGRNYSEWFVSPKGDPSGSGKLDSPIDLKTALHGGKQSVAIKPGDIIWLRGGEYRGSYTSEISGNTQNPVHIRQYPGERAIIDKSAASRDTGALNVRGSHVWFWDFEVANSYPDRKSLDPRGELNPWRGSGINVYAANTKYINLIIRDNGHGIGLWNEDGDVEIYGCLIFNNGNNKKEHGIYAHNKTGTHLLAGNLIFSNAGYGMHVYANSAKSAVSGFDIVDNTIFENGALTSADQVADQILVGGVEGVSARRIRLHQNIVYTNPDSTNAKSRGIRLGYRDQQNKDVKLEGNLVVGKIPLKILWWNSVEACKNTIISSGRGIEIQTPADPEYSNYIFAQNTVLSNGKPDRDLILNGKKTALDAWQRQINDAACQNATETNIKAYNSLRVFVNENRYDKTLAYVTIYNGDKTQVASIDLSGFLEKGAKFEISDAQNYFGESVLSGVYQGKSILLPLAGKKVTAPIGETEQAPVHTGTDFSVFIVRKVSVDSGK